MTLADFKKLYDESEDFDDWYTREFAAAIDCAENGPCAWCLGVMAYEKAKAAPLAN